MTSEHQQRNDLHDHNNNDGRRTEASKSIFPPTREREYKAEKKDYPKEDHSLQLLNEEHDQDVYYQDNQFSPIALSTARFVLVRKVLADPRWAHHMRKVIDFGCGEADLLRHLIAKLPRLREVVNVDLNPAVCEDARRQIQPLPYDHISPRKEPLHVALFRGSIEDPDPVLEHADAVVAVELIEHLHHQPLVRAVRNVFGFVRPKMVVFTTPNAEFNVAFENVYAGSTASENCHWTQAFTAAPAGQITGGKKFRHYDHKFEWRRNEFKSFAEDVCISYPEYKHCLTGVGRLPRDHPECSVGFASQAVVFIRTDLYAMLTENEPLPAYEPAYQSVEDADRANGRAERTYSLLGLSKYPVSTDTRTRDEILLDEAKYYLNKMSTEGEEKSVRIRDLLDFSTFMDLSATELEIARILQDKSFQIRVGSHDAVYVDLHR